MPLKFDGVCDPVINLRARCYPEACRSQALVLASADAQLPCGLYSPRISFDTTCYRLAVYFSLSFTRVAAASFARTMHCQARAEARIVRDGDGARTPALGGLKGTRLFPRALYTEETARTWLAKCTGQKERSRNGRLNILW